MPKPDSNLMFRHASGRLWWLCFEGDELVWRDEENVAHPSRVAASILEAAKGAWLENISVEPVSLEARVFMALLKTC